LIFITLPTPKQEEVANLIVANNTFAKIVCIGGSVAIASGVEKKVPDWLVNIEFLWRLRYETLRRTKRLIQSFYFFFKGNYLTSKIKNMDIEIA
jgi:UDP-N-acetyl-D-mannosaminuronic acid transferase (WecB/TagA/CpsF family)